MSDGDHSNNLRYEPNADQSLVELLSNPGKIPASSIHVVEMSTCLYLPSIRWLTLLSKIIFFAALPQEGRSDSLSTYTHIDELGHFEVYTHNSNSEHQS